ncbi:chemotaxis protein CheA [Pseudomonas sp. KNUC1026]|uniref:chemotaxis protein CheA n=1 Tax=Pseudomonas sp. KNUC1026 TaxID=2893890 RepID=UPI001F3A092E|nr:chemotaxis protein CheA [Pseudomonas sp. KNUC1026]UFH50056.1 chemotaxis protein CheA [Pseudomonas sp. KNUC1026]
MPLNLDAALQTFIAEARELLQEMEQALLRLEGEPGDGQAMDAVFRAAHTIKGSAGLFGLDALVSFAHVVEDLLDRLRGGSLSVNRERIALMLACNDHLGTLLEQVAVRRNAPTEAMQATETELRERLLASGAGSASAAAATAAAPASPSAERLWHVSARFGQDTFRHGMDPLSFLRYLDSLGERQALLIDDHAIATAQEFDPETCLLGFHLRLRADCEASVLRDAFAFVEEESDIAIFDLASQANEFNQWLSQWPAERAQWLSEGLGEVVVQQAPPAPASPSADAQEAAEPAAAAKPAAAPVAAGSDSRQAWVRVRADKLETLINLAGELVTAGAGARLLAEQSADEPLIEASTAISNLVEAVLESTLAMRMVPIGETFNRFHRTVRDVSQALGKDIELVVSGGDTELDKALVEQLSDPLMHLLRNAMDHGIEAPEQRLAAGKPARGRLQLNAFHDAGNIVVELSDDGAGLNRERILAKARERGLVGASEPADRELLALIFEPGFSTAASVTNLSGRGVGMDVVKRNITGLRGHIELLSPPGQGTTVRIRLPLTLAMIDGLLVEAAGSSYVLPLGMVRECMEIRPEQRQQVRAKGHVDLRGEVLPVVFLRDHFGLQGCAPKRENIVVIQAQGIKAGLVVDDLLGEYQTVIKPLGPMFSGVKGISGSSVLGSGVVALILDAPALLKDLIERGSTLAHSPSLYSLSA